MPVSHLRSSLAAALTALAVAPVPVHAAPAVSGPPGPDPLEATAGVPDAHFRSAFAGYRGLGYETVGSWRAANEAVERAGGWKAYAREAGEPDPPAPTRAPAGPDRHGHQGASR